MGCFDRAFYNSDIERFNLSKTGYSSDFENIK